MIESIRKFFARTMESAPAAAADAGADGEAAEAERQRLHVAACALLLELAYADDAFSDGERVHVASAVRRHLALDEQAADELIALADEQRRNAIDLYQFTSLIRDQYDDGQKTLLAEIMWGVVLADGDIHADEDYLMRKIANLLDLEPGYLSYARKQAAGERRT
jgi:uncharacterized tellurite resistance protein B-like protein